MNGDVMTEVSAIGDAFDVVRVDVVLCLGREACGRCFGTFKMGERKLPFEERLPAVYGKNLAVGAFYDKHRAVPVLLRVFLCGRKFRNPAILEGLARPSERARCA